MNLKFHQKEGQSTNTAYQEGLKDNSIKRKDEISLLQQSIDRL